MSDAPDSRDLGNVRAFVPETDDGVPRVLREALDLAVTSKLRGVVILMRFHGKDGYDHRAAGDLDLGDILLAFCGWVFHQFSLRELARKDPDAPQ